MWKIKSFSVGVTSPLLTPSHFLLLYIVIICISLHLFCSGSKYLQYGIYFFPYFTGTGILAICSFYLCTCALVQHLHHLTITFPLCFLCLSFVKDWVVFYPLILSKYCLPFQMMATFWQGKVVRKVKATSEELWILLWQEGRRMVPCRSEGTSLPFVTSGERGWGPRVLVSFCVDALSSVHLSLPLPLPALLFPLHC